ncbi:MAG: GGDEF domain-containing protein, partial [Acidobacteria bacterium]|nr:GGDEF domain-containing protein [Acidobacteriota bacterium]
MPQSANAPRSPVQTSAEESFLELIIETMETLDRPVRAQFLQRFIKSMTQVELTEQLAIEHWDQILARRQELSESLGKPVALKTAMVDVLAASNHLRMPILMEYEELKKLQINAATDALTGLYHRRLFDEYFAKELNRSKRYGQHLALVMMDLHKFKEVNDRFGHLQGDQALQIAATTLRRTLRTSDYAFRIGGDEFALLLPQSDPEQAGVLAKRLRTSYEAAILPMKIDAPLALDFGVSVFPEDSDVKETLI